MIFYQSYNIECKIKNSTVSNDVINFKNNISPEEIINYYYPLGYHMFKLEGRTLSSIEIILNYARYFIKPEHQFNFIQEAVRGLFDADKYTYI